MATSPETLLQATRSRRLSRLTSRGREDWAYSSTLAAVDSPANSLVSFPISLYQPTSSQLNWLSVKANWRVRKPTFELCLLLVDLSKRQLVISPSGLGFPTRTISRMWRIETSSLEICTSFGLSLKMDFTLVEKRDELFKLVRQLNCLGGMVSQLFHNLQASELFTCQVLGKVPCLQLDERVGEDESFPPSNFDEQEFIQWFLTMVASSDNVEPMRLQREIELAVLPNQEPSAELLGISPKRGKLVSNLVLMDGEVLVSIEDFVTMLPMNGRVFGVPVLGEMFLTSLQMFFSTYFAYPESTDGTLPSLRYGRHPQKVITTRQIPIKSIAKLLVVTGGGSQPTLQVETYLGEVHCFLFDRDSSFPQKYADQVREQQQASPPRVLTTGLALAPVYQIEQEFARQCGVGGRNGVLMDNKVCDTYPNQLLLPAGFSSASLIAASKFRSRARVPSVTWQTNTGITLSRSSQPMSGVLQRGNKFDEELVIKLQVRYIVDCRGPLAVLGNTLAKGKGAESLSRYPNTSLLFLGIGNIHTMRQAANAKSTEAWLLHQTNLWQGAIRVAEMLCIEQVSVLVHCSDGWDRTSQIVALAQLLMDPYYRTLRGLCVLIDKDFCHFGFQFHKRCVGEISQERSPIWIQFIQCIWQAIRQLPNEFEYNADLLAYLARDPFAGRFPTLGYDSIRLRQAAVGGGNGQTLWHFVLSQSGFINPTYQPCSKPVIWIDPNRLIKCDYNL